MTTNVLVCTTWRCKTLQPRRSGFVPNVLSPTTVLNPLPSIIDELIQAPPTAWTADENIMSTTTSAIIASPHRNFYAYLSSAATRQMILSNDLGWKEVMEMAQCCSRGDIDPASVVPPVIMAAALRNRQAARHCQWIIG